MAARSAPPQAGGMTDTALRPRAALLTLRSLAIAGALTLALTGCSTAAPVSTDEILPDVVDASDTGVDASGENDGEATIIGAELVGSFAAIAAETYAENNDPMPTVEFTSASTVVFTFPGTLGEVTRFGNCQVAYGVLDAEGIDITIVDDSGSFDCTAEVEG